MLCLILVRPNNWLWLVTPIICELSTFFYSIFFIFFNLKLKFNSVCNFLTKSYHRKKPQKYFINTKLYLNFKQLYLCGKSSNLKLLNQKILPFFGDWYLLRVKTMRNIYPEFYMKNKKILEAYKNTKSLSLSVHYSRQSVQTSSPLISNFATFPTNPYYIATPFL